MFLIILLALPLVYSMTLGLISPSVNNEDRCFSCSKYGKSLKRSKDKEEVGKKNASEI